MPSNLIKISDGKGGQQLSNQGRQLLKAHGKIGSRKYSRLGYALIALLHLKVEKPHFCFCLSMFSSFLKIQPCQRGFQAKIALS